jgi:hypothetical protein
VQVRVSQAGAKGVGAVRCGSAEVKPPCVGG